MRYAAMIAAALAVIAPAANAKSKNRVQCKTATIHATVSTDNSRWVLTSAVVCTNGKISLNGRRYK
jgi:hypothetical protein